MRCDKAATHREHDVQEPRTRDARRTRARDSRGRRGRRSKEAYDLYNESDEQRVAAGFEAEGYDVWALMEHKPDGVSYDEYAWYINDLADDEAAFNTFCELGPNSLNLSELYGGSVPFAIAIILWHGSVDDATVDDIINNCPDDTDAIDFARACTLVGATTRAEMLPH